MRISGTRIVFSTVLEGRDEYIEWKKTRREYVRTLGHYLLVFSESNIVDCFDQWETQISELEKVDRGHNYLTALLIISLLHYFNRSYDQIKVHVPFVAKMLEHRNRSIICASAKVFRWLAAELPDNIEFLKDLLTNHCTKWINQSNTRYAGLRILQTAGKFILPTVFELTSHNFAILWPSAIGDDVDLRIIAAKVMHTHLLGLPPTTAAFTVKKLFNDCIKQLATLQNQNHGAVLILGYIVELYPNDIDSPTLINSLVDSISVKSELLVYTCFKLLLDLTQRCQHLFTPDTIQVLFDKLISSCKRYIQSTRLFMMIDKFMDAFHQLLIPTTTILEFLQQVVKSQKYKSQQKLAFTLVTKILNNWRDVTVSASFFLEAEPCPQFIQALKLRMALFNEVKPKLLVVFNEGLGIKTTQAQNVLSLHILRVFDTHLIKNKDAIYKHIHEFTRSQYEDVRLLVTEVLPLFTGPEALDDLLYMALFDFSKHVRAKAVLQLNQPSQLAHIEMLPQILTDPSYKVRRNAIPIIAAVAPLNPMQFHVPISAFVQHSFLAMASSSNPCICARISTLLPLIAKHFLPFCLAFVPQITKICFSFLESGEKIEQPPNYSSNPVRITDVIHRDMSHDGHALISNKLPFDSNCTNLLRIFHIENTEWIEKRDANLFLTYECLAEHLGPFLDELIPIFIKVFSTTRSTQVYLNALEALIQITKRINSASDIPSQHPSLIPVLMTLLRKKPAEAVAIKILKLVGSFGITCFPRGVSDIQTESDPIIDFDFKSPSFFTDFMLNSLLKLLNEPHSSIFEAITSIFVKEAESAAKFLSAIVAAFMKSLVNSKDQQKDVLFNQLEIISYYSGAKMQPYVTQISPYIQHNIGMTSAIRLACVLSYFLKSELIPSIQPLYQAAIRNMSSFDDLKYTEILYNFLTYAIIFQNQPLDIFVSECEHIIFSTPYPPPELIQMILESLITIVQLGEALYECSHISRICIRLLKMNMKNQVFQLLFSLAVYCRLDVDIIELVCQEENINNPQISLVRDFLKNRSLKTESFLQHKSISLYAEIPEYVPLQKPMSQNVFAEIQPPQFNNTAKWLEDLCSTVVISSPSIAIRACHKIVKHSPSFRMEIFPIAFLSCWKVARESHQKSFSKVIQSIFESENPIDPAFIRLAELLLRAGHPLQIKNYLIASSCQSPAQGLRFLVRDFKPDEQETIELMLTLNMRLGRIHSSRGILKTVKLPTAGKWSEKLGDWERALEFHREEGTTGPGNLIRCYARLERWDEIRSMTKIFNEMTSEDKREYAIWFAWAYYRINDLQKVSYFVNRFKDSTDLNLMIFNLIFLISSEQYKLAQESIDTAFKLLAKDCSIFSTLNANQADANLAFANNLVELEEALTIKQSNSKTVPKMWKKRLSYLNGDSYSWMRLVEIRNLALKPSENKKSYLKLMSNLIKERRWALVDAFWGGLTQSINEPSVQIAFYKLQWARDRKRFAVDSMRVLNIIYKSKEFESFKQEISVVPESVLVSFAHDVAFNYKGILNEDQTVNYENLFNFSQKWQKDVPLPNKQRARFLRIEGRWRVQLVRTSENNSSLIQIIELFREAAELCSDDYRNWAEFAYANSKAIGDESYIMSAINGFLKVTQLKPSNSLEYLCQLFSLFFRYGGSVTIPDEIVNLPPEIVSQILPQIVCQINHEDDKVRNIVHEILIKFGNEHFQAIVFSLHLLIRSEDKQKSSIATDLLEKIAQKHQELAREADIFVDGLLRSAVTWYELWMTKLDAAFIESRKSFDKGTTMLKTLFDTRNHPKCTMDKQFLKALESPLATCASSIARFTATEGSFNTLWTQLKRFFEILRDRFKKIETIELVHVSEALANKKSFLLSIPGTYIVNGQSPLISHLDPTLPVLSTQQHPRLLYMTDTSGIRWKFLLKGNEDLRLDQRIMQFFNLINSLLSSNKVTAELGVSISKYAIIPFAPNAGLISWVTGADTLHQLVMDYRRNNGIPQWAESENISMFVGEIFDGLMGEQKIEMWEEISPRHHAFELRDTIWERTPDAVTWLKTIETFVLSTALMSMAGYIIGLGDRHPSNIMIQRQSGHVVHIDFGDSFEVALNRDRMPEKVPFRLTRMLINAFGASGVEGRFRSACEDIMRILRENKSSVIAQLEIFVHEPIFVNKDNGMCSEGQSGILDRVQAKLDGKDPEVFDEEKELSVEDQVGDLIKIASDPYRYVMHYIGWCQFW